MNNPLNFTVDQFVDAALANEDRVVVQQTSVHVFVEAVQVGATVAVSWAPVEISAFSVCHFLGHIQILTVDGECFQLYQNEVREQIPNLYGAGVDSLIEAAAEAKS